MLTEAPVVRVQLDGVTLLKIMKHCRDSIGKVATGNLLGMANNKTGNLECTNCFPIPAGDSAADTDYPVQMMRSLREVNVDHQMVGWYQSAHSGSFFTSSLVDTQYNWQTQIQQSVVLIYDPVKSAQGSVAVRAFRLSDAFMQLYKERKFSTERITELGLSYHDMMEEIPVTIRNSSIVSALMWELDGKKYVRAGSDFERLHLVGEPVLEANLEKMTECLDDYGQDQYRFNKYQQHAARQKQVIQQHKYHRKLENQKRIAKGLPPLPEDDLTAVFKTPVEPSRLDSLLIKSQLAQYCQEVDQFAGSMFTKLFACNELQK